METNENILLDLHNQFANNQNHHQSVFTQFLIALLSLFAGYGYVYIHTSSEVSAFCQQLIVNSVGVEYYSPNFLLLTSAVVLAVLALLNVLLLNLGYSFRRDQHVNKKIREKFLDKSEYESTFGELYNSDNKSFTDFLPNFYAIFFWFIFGFQVFILIITSSRVLGTLESEKCCNCLLLLLDLSLTILSILLYLRTYRKYWNNIINSKRHEKT